MDNWQGQSAAALGREIEAGRLCPVDLAEAFLDAIDAHPEHARIYTVLTRARARAEAMAARERAKLGLRRGPLDGVPVSWKDLFDSAGIPTEGGSRLLAGRVPERDCAVLATATLGGLVCLGKTHMTELAFSGLGLNPVTATPPCVNDPAAVPGGSSSGGAASVAFGLAAAAVGSDTGGSVRLPAVWNDLVGLKTSHGSLPMEGVLPLVKSFDTIGPLTRSVEDAALMLGALQGARPVDLAGADLRGVRLMMLSTVVLDDLSPAPKQGFEQAVARLEAAGARVETRAIPTLPEVLPISPTLFSAEAYGLWREVIEAQPDVMFSRILERFRSGASLLAADFVAGWQRLEAVRRDWQAAAEGFDAVITPTAPNLPPDAARLLSDPDYYVHENLRTLRNTRIVNLMGLCALTLPTGVPSTGLSLIGPAGSEARLLRLGAAAERAMAG